MERRQRPEHETEHENVPEVDVEPVNVESTAIEPIVRQVQLENRFDVERALQEFEYRSSIIERIRPLAVKQLRQKDMIAMGSGNDAPCYLQATGAERLKPLLGTTYPGGIEPKRERRELGNGEFAIVYRGWIASYAIGVQDYVVGGRASNEKFFDRFDDDGNRLPVSELEVEKAAWSNWLCRAISGLAGLRGLTVADLKMYGHNVGQAIAFSSGSKGGAGASGSGKAPDRFGPEEDRGKPWAEVSDAGLQFYKKASERALGDDSRKKWWPQEKRRLEQIENELRQREQGGKE